jgi:hypothetical protein
MSWPYRSGQRFLRQAPTDMVRAMATTDPAMATTVAMRPATTAAMPPHTMDMDMADHTTERRRRLVPS